MGSKLSKEEKYLKAQERWTKRANTLLRRKGLKSSKRRHTGAKKGIHKVSIKGLEKKLKALLYPLIKKRDGPNCISCKKQGLVGRNWAAGHYLKAELCNLIARYDIRNINSQCNMYCNKNLRGNTIEYRKAMLVKYGVEVVDDLEANYRLPLNLNPRLYLTELIEHYKNIDKL